MFRYTKIAIVTTVLAAAAATCLARLCWQLLMAGMRVKKTLSIHTIYTTRRELFYWAAILFTFALGTAAGDLAAEGLHLGYAKSALIFGALIGGIAIAHYAFRFNAIAAFWIANILTRPFGASCADLLSKPLAEGGVGLGTVGTSGVFLVTILTLVGYLTISQRDLPSYQK